MKLLGPVDGLAEDEELVSASDSEASIHARAAGRDRAVGAGVDRLGRIQHRLHAEHVSGGVAQESDNRLREKIPVPVPPGDGEDVVERAGVGRSDLADVHDHEGTSFRMFLVREARSDPVKGPVTGDEPVVHGRDRDLALVASCAAEFTFGHTVFQAVAGVEAREGVRNVRENRPAGGIERTVLGPGVVALVEHLLRRSAIVGQVPTVVLVSGHRHGQVDRIGRLAGGGGLVRRFGFVGDRDVQDPSPVVGTDPGRPIGPELERVQRGGRLVGIHRPVTGDHGRFGFAVDEATNRFAVVRQAVGPVGVEVGVFSAGRDSVGRSCVEALHNHRGGHAQIGRRERLAVDDFEGAEHLERRHRDRDVAGRDEHGVFGDAEHGPVVEVEGRIAFANAGRRLVVQDQRVTIDGKEPARLERDVRAGAGGHQNAREHHDDVQEKLLCVHFLPPLFLQPVRLDGLRRTDRGGTLVSTSTEGFSSVLMVGLRFLAMDSSSLWPCKEIRPYLFREADSWLSHPSGGYQSPNRELPLKGHQLSRLTL